MLNNVFDKANAKDLSSEPRICPFNYLAIEWLLQLGFCTPTQPQIDHFEALFKAIIINNFKVAAKLETLTDCEIELLSYYIQGFATKKIAAKLGITTRTVRYHRDNILRKSNCGSLYQVIYKLTTLAVVPKS